MSAVSDELAAVLGQVGPDGRPRYTLDQVRAGLLAVAIAGRMLREPPPAGIPELVAWFASRAGLGPQASAVDFLAAAHRFVEATVPPVLRRELGELFRRRGGAVRKSLDLREAFDRAQRLQGGQAPAQVVIPQKDVW